MKKKILFSTVTAAAIMFSGAAFNKAEAAKVKCDPTTQVTYKVVTQEDAQKLMKQYFAKYNVTFTSSMEGSSVKQQQFIQWTKHKVHNTTTSETTNEVRM